MKSPPSSTGSPWTPDAPIQADIPASKQLATDVCVIGAGIAGLTCAFQLARQGRSVIVLEKEGFGVGETGVTTAHLTNCLDRCYYELEKWHGPEGARLAAQSHTAGIDFIERIVRSGQIDCGFTRLDGCLFEPPGGDLAALEAELEAVHRAGLTDVELVHQSALPHFNTGSYLRFPNQAQFHPLHYLAGLARHFQNLGGLLFLHTAVVQVEGGAKAQVVTESGLTISPQAIIVAANTPFNDRVTLHTKQAAYRSYVVAGRVPRGSVPLALYWDTLDPLHYVRLHPGVGEAAEDLLLVGGEDHKTGQGNRQEREAFIRLEHWARERFPALGPIEHRWSGQVMESVDGLAYIGRNPGDADNVFVVTGDSGLGMTHGTIAGMLLGELVLGREHPWADLYAPSRKPLRALGTFTREALNTAAQYKEWITGGDDPDVDQIPPGVGAVVRRGVRKLAIYRDAEGCLHERSAVCPHLGCVVAWNQAESSWDCPCHGSRFSATGEVLNGPSTAGLAAVDQAEPALHASEA